MREIKFRGKTPEGKWVYGDLIHVTKDFKESVQILHWTGDHPSQYASEVISETVGQFTGLKDNRGNDIYEEDLVKAKGFASEIYRIEFVEGGFCLTDPDLNGYPTDINIIYPSKYGCQIEVIGNAHDNN